MKKQNDYAQHLPPEMRPSVSEGNIRELIAEFASNDFSLNPENTIGKVSRWLKSHGIEVEK